MATAALATRVTRASIKAALRAAGLADRALDARPVCDDGPGAGLTVTVLCPSVRRDAPDARGFAGRVRACVLELLAARDRPDSRVRVYGWMNMEID